MKARQAVSRLLGAALLASDAAHALTNANHIFNSVHSAMRQWGSSLHHNGMSFYLVSVPAGTQVYHGTGESEPIDKMDWVALEPEHALAFAWPLREELPLEDGHETCANKVYRGAGSLGAFSVDVSSPQAPLGHVEDPIPGDGVGYLHTSRTRREELFLYLDGQSAAESDKGTLDTQDVLLFNGSLSERERGFALCDIIEREWDSRLAGVVRMEHGFEIIVCSFAKTLEPIRTATVNTTNHEMPDQYAPDMNLLRNIAARFHGIGAGRVTVYWESLITAYTHPLPSSNGSSPPTEQWPANNTEHRLVHWSSKSLNDLRQNLFSGVKRAIDRCSDQDVNWQAIADMIVHRYAIWLRSLLAPRYAERPDALLQELVLAQRPFIDAHAPDTTLEAQRCSQQFIPPMDGEFSLAGQAIAHVALVTCETVAFAKHDLEEALGDDSSATESLPQDTAKAIIDRIRLLMDYLQWTAWKECRGCEDDEVCAVAIWPRGSTQDHEHPRCLNASEYSRSGHEYWWGPH